MKNAIIFVALLIVVGIATFYFINRPSQEGAILEGFENAVAEFRIDYAKLEEGAKDHPKGDELLSRIREREAWLNDDNPENDRDAYELIAFDSRQLGDDAGSILGYRASISLFENNIFIWNNLGVAYQEIGEYKKSETAYKKIIEISPGDVPNYRKLADLYLYNLTEKEGDIPAVIEEGLQRVPDHPDLLSYLAVYYQNKGDKENAILYFERLLRITPLNQVVRDELNKLRK